ncbi:sugar-binding domain-containing protein [Chitinophaga sp. GCM10012297]|uniref:Glycoside hydrolase family 2 immunoglobulin-like beta-sandwich domain-containing protein n=1 Tax=Chitinophaga chungangae TaxID=2821488 RepID=A0ABS3Y9E2_9BACT|nr:sugar-binding domain-containing protein [Chitinophaga chungangae]MBO9151297.1 hypothetical protein [Chitinophaga chungangae]
MKNNVSRYVFLLLLLAAAPHVNAQQRENTSSISLAGIWKFKLDAFETGISANGVQLLPSLPEEITLPGSTDQAGKGYKTQDMGSLRLTRLFEYKGPAWYEKKIFVPAEWQHKDVQLFLERVHWQSSIWINGKPAGKRESLSTPHTYMVTGSIQPGKINTILIRVNNDNIYGIAYSHAISAETQTNWNGITGKMMLQAFDKVRIGDVEVFPDIAQKQARLKIKVVNNSGKPVQGKLNFTSGSKTATTAFSGKDSIIHAEAVLPLGGDMRLWDEFDPSLYTLHSDLSAGAGEQTYRDSRDITFGMREITTDNKRIAVNGRPVFIRATVHCAEFPVTGYPPADIDAWLRIFYTCKAYGLNAVRFHSWCPPEAAFDAADQLGLYLQVENSDWRFTVGQDSATNRFLQEEAVRILETYGNHPSFTMMGEGNELVGPTVKPFLSGLVSEWRKKDPRRIYTGSAAYPMVPENQFNVFYGARPQRWKEGLKGRFNVKPLDTRYDYAEYVAKSEVPMITHEVGQWCVYPNFAELPKYTGVLKPYNYELFRESLREHHMLDQAEQFTMASGKFQVIQKKEEIESYLRTPQLAGYHLLQLNDFPGQGTSPVGVVDVFWDPKPYVSAKEFSAYQAARVPLMRTDGLTYTNSQTFRATIQFANFGPSAMENVSTEWSLQYEDGRAYEKGSFPQQHIAIGSPFTLGEISLPLNRIEKASRMTLTVNAGGHSNEWRIWVYPATLPAVPAKGVLVTGSLNDKAKKTLQNGGKVLLLADTAAIASDVPPGFSGISWNAVWSGMPPNLLGILCDPQHPALADFPTEYHSNWQWWDVVAHSRPMLLDSMPASFKPLVQMIPDWNKNNKIGLVFEAKVGKGSLLMTSVDLVHDMDKRPVARQLLYSLQRYAAGEQFTPGNEISLQQLEQLFKTGK